MLQNERQRKIDEINQHSDEQSDIFTITLSFFSSLKKKKKNSIYFYCKVFFGLVFWPLR